MQGPFYITTPIYYVNDVPHIGHAYTTLACDVMARFKRLQGYRVWFLTGTDEHGQKVEKAARAKSMGTQAFTDEVSANFRELTQVMQFSNDDFIRTTEIRHKKGAQALWQRLQEKGYIYKATYAGWYSVRDEAYYQESELNEGKAPTGAEVEWVEEESYFFKLSAFQDRLLAFYEANPDFVSPRYRMHEVINFVKGGKEKIEGSLKDLSISRTTFNWGIPVPDDNKHVMYVWLDALANYLTALGYPDEHAEKYRLFWAPDDAVGKDNIVKGREGNEQRGKAIHVVGKDILRFHAIYWPAFLMAAELPLPKRIVAHGWWTNEGEKISKSLGNVIDPFQLVKEFGLDQVRYFLLREVPFGSDGNYTRSGMVNRINADLANTVGNLAQRVLSMINKNCEGRVPARSREEKEDSILLGLGYTNTEGSLASKACNALGNFEFHMALAHIIELANKANEYIDKQAPWVLKKKDPQRMESVLATLAEVIRCISILLQPFMPGATHTLLSQLGLKEEERGLMHLAPHHALVAGKPLPVPEGVFPRFVEEKNNAVS